MRPKTLPTQADPQSQVTYGSKDLFAETAAPLGRTNRGLRNASIVWSYFGRAKFLRPIGFL